MVRFTLLLIYTVKTYNLLNSISQTHATVDFSVSVFSTDMHSSSLVFDHEDFCTDINYLLSVHSTGTIT